MPTPYTPIGGTKDLVCERCQQVWHSRNNHGRWCPPCRTVRRKEQAEAWRKDPVNKARRNAANKEQGHARRAALRSYGLTEEDYAGLYAAQDGRCAICTTPHPVLCVDHSHITGGVRGLLCRSCNRSIGQLGDTAEALQRAADYLHAAERTA